MSNDLTDRQAEILAFITDFIRSNGYGPTIREIGDEHGIRSPNGVVGTLRALERKGLIRRNERISRGISVIGGVCPMCGRRVRR